MVASFEKIKLNIKSFTIEKVLAVTLLSTFESEVSVLAKNYFYKQTQLVELYKKSFWGQLLSVYLQR